MLITGSIAVVTGAGSGIGKATAYALVEQKVKAIALVDMNPDVANVAADLTSVFPGTEAKAFVGNVTDDAFRSSVFDAMTMDDDVPRICVYQPLGSQGIH